MFTVPALTPVSCGYVVGNIEPAGTNTLDVMVAAAGLLVVKVIVKPPAGAAPVKHT